MLIRITFLVSLLGAAHAFLSTPKPIEALVDLAKAQKGLAFDVTLSVGQNKEQPVHLPGCQMELGGLSDMHSKIPMPGAHGHHPKLSSGPRHLKILQDPSFISMEGQKEVHLEDSCWELIWRDGEMSGCLICALGVPQEYRRGEAVLPQGPIYLSFPVWTHESLATMQARKLDVVTRGDLLLKERDDELAKMQQTDNLFAKALHYRNAAEAVERFSLTGYHKYKSEIPESNQVLSIGRGLLMNREGIAWAPKNDGGPFSKRANTIMGSARLSVQTP